MKRCALVLMCLCFLLAPLAGSAAAQGIGVGVKGGVIFPDFSSDVVDFESRTGWQAGLFVGGNRGGVVGVQAEFNYLRKEASLDVTPNVSAKLEYLQIPILLRLQSPSRSAAGAQVYGIVGPSFDIKLRESLEGRTVEVITDGFETFDLGGMIGAGVEAGRVIIEGRYSRGFRRVNKNFQDTLDIKGHSFAVLAGIRFN